MLRQQGVTLLELLVVIIISTILIVSAQLLLSPLLKRLESQRITDEIYQLCLHSRALAAHMKLPLTLCGSSNGEQCDNNWAEGVLLFIDQNRSHRFEGGETRLQYRSLQIGSSTLTWTGFGGHTLGIEAFGIPFASNGSFTYCSADKDPKYSQQVIVGRSGRVRRAPDNNGDGEREAIDGGIINCN